MRLKITLRFTMLLFIFLSLTRVYGESPVLSSDGVLSYRGVTGVNDSVNLSLSVDETELIVSITSDGVANQYNYPIASVGQFRFVSKEHMSDMLSKAANLELYVEVVHKHESIGRIFEMEAMFDLVKYVNLSHSTVQSGAWSDPATWGGLEFMPLTEARILVKAGHVVTVDGVFKENYRSIRVDGTLRFATDANTSLKVNTMVVNNMNIDGTKGRFEMGTALDPIQDAYTARLIIDKLSDFEVSNTSSADYDPHKLGLGLIAHGEVSIHGKKKTGYATFNGTPSGVSSVVLDKVPSDWEVGDHIVIAGVQRDADGDEARYISGIAGNRVSFQEVLTKDHTTPNHTKSGLVLKVHVINTTRNAIIETAYGLNRVEKIGDEFLGRGHVMFMHTNSAVVYYGGFYNLGRTNKQGIMLSVKQDKDTGAILRIANNPIARYPVHFHRAGNSSESGIIKGSAVVNSPGWGYVNHRSNAIIEDNVAYNVSGASFVTEAGDEEGTMKNNVSIRTIGNGLENFAGKFSFLKDLDKVSTNVTNFGSAGDGFWMQSRLVAVENNVASGFTGSGFMMWNEAIDGIIALPEDGSIPTIKEEREPSSIQKALFIKDNLSYGGLNGYNFGFVSASAYGGTSQVINQTCYNITYGIRKKYDTSIIFDNTVLIGDLEHPVGDASKSHSNGHNIIFLNPHAEGFLNGLDFEHRKENAGVLEGGYFNNINNIRINIRHDRDQNVLFNKDIQFGVLSAQAIANVVADNYPGFDGNQYNFFGYSDKPSKVDDGFVDDSSAGGSGKISNMLIQQANGNYKKTYLQTEQDIDYIPWPSPNEDVDVNWLDKTNGELQVLIAADPTTYDGAVFSAEYYDSAVIEIPAVNEKYFNVVLGPETATVPFIDMYVRDSIVDMELKTANSIVLDITDVVYDPNLLGVTYSVESNSNTGYITATISGNDLTLNGLALGTSTIEIKGTNAIETNEFVIDTFDVTVISDNVYLLATDDVFDVNYNTTTELSVLENDIWANGQEVQIISLTQGTNGNTSINTNGTIKYVPTTSFSGADSFTYTLEDIYGSQNTAIVAIEVSSIAPDYSVFVEEGQSVELDVLTSVSSVMNGTDGNVGFSGTDITYTQTNASHDGSDQFTYTIGGNTGTVFIIILPETTIEAPFAGPGVLFYDGFESGDFATENWTLEPGVAETNTGKLQIASYKSYKEVYSAHVKRGTYIQKQISTIDYHDIIVSYHRRTALNAHEVGGVVVTGNYFDALWSIDGTNWEALEARVEESQEWAFTRLKLPPEANNQANLYIKFDVESAHSPEKLYIDEVLVTGTPIINGVILKPEIMVVNQNNGSTLIFEGALGLDVEKSIKITNEGTGDLELENFQITGTGFSIITTQLPSVLKPENSTVVKIMASSIPDIPENGTLTFASNDTDELNYNINLLTKVFVEPEAIFYDGFESGDLTTENWTIPDLDTSNSKLINVNLYTYMGDYSAHLKKGGGIQNQISTIGYEDVVVSYYRRTNLNEPRANGTPTSGHYFDPLWSIDGSTWYPLETRIEDTQDWGFVSLALPAAANNQANLYLLFDVYSNRHAEKAYVDEVLVMGTPIASGNTSARQSEIKVEDSKVFEGALTVYPNPASRFINFGGAEKDLIQTIAIFNTSGQRVLYKEIDKVSQLQNFDLENLSNGIYFLRIDSGNNGITNVKLVIDK